MGDGFLVRAARARQLTGFVPRYDCLLGGASFRVVMRQQLRMGFDRLRESRFQELSHLQVVLLPGALEQRLICRILNERMFEDVTRAWRATALIQQLVPHQLLEPGLQHRWLHRRQVLQHLVGEFPPEHCSPLRDLAQVWQAIEPCHQRVLQGRRYRYLGE